jgi:hypothetical protein
MTAFKAMTKAAHIRAPARRFTDYLPRPCVMTKGGG